jgi:hypothetical protein
MVRLQSYEDQVWSSHKIRKIPKNAETPKNGGIRVVVVACRIRQAN